MFLSVTIPILTFDQLNENIVNYQSLKIINHALGQPCHIVEVDVFVVACWWFFVVVFVADVVAAVVVDDDNDDDAVVGSCYNVIIVVLCLLSLFPIN